MRTLQTFAYAAIASAKNARTCRADYSAAQQISRFRSFNWAELGKFQTAHSLQSGSTIEAGGQSSHTRRLTLHLK
jgi:hypothetical protein